MCNHEKLVSVNCTIRCAVCGAVLDIPPMAEDAPKKSGRVTTSPAPDGAPSPEGEGVKGNADEGKSTRGRIRRLTEGKAEPASAAKQDAGETRDPQNIARARGKKEKGE